LQILGTEQQDADASRKWLAGHDLSVAYALLRITLKMNIALHDISRILAGPASFVPCLAKQFEGPCERSGKLILFPPISVALQAWQSLSIVMSP
jgi:hypothetical protein